MSGDESEPDYCIVTYGPVSGSNEVYRTTGTDARPSDLVSAEYMKVHLILLRQLQYPTCTISGTFYSTNRTKIKPCGSSFSSVDRESLQTSAPLLGRTP